MTIDSRDFFDQEAGLLRDIEFYADRTRHDLNHEQTMRFWRRAMRDLATYYTTREEI